MEDNKELLEEVNANAKMASAMIYAYAIVTLSTEDLAKFKKLVEDIAPASSDTIEG